MNKPGNEVDNNGNVNDESNDNISNGENSNKPDGEIEIEVDEIPDWFDKDIDNFLKSDKIDEILSNPIRDLQASLGASRNILEYRYSFKEVNINITKDNISKIEDVDIASALLEKVRLETLSNIATYLFTNNLDNHKAHIITLLQHKKHLGKCPKCFLCFFLVSYVRR